MSKRSITRNLFNCFVLAIMMWAVITLSGCVGLANSQFSLTPTPTSLAFGQVAVGSTSRLSVLVKNTGSTNVAISGASASGSAFEISGPTMPLTLSSGQSATWISSFTPRAAGIASGSFSVMGSGSTPLAVIQATGSGETLLPSVTSQPASQSATAGQKATFSVTASGTAPLSYQWMKAGKPIAGASSSTYETPATATADSGSQFAVIVSNSAGNVTSNAAILTVNTTPIVITVNPNNATVIAGSTQQFVGNVTGASNTAATWSVSGAGCTGAACGTISADGLYIPPTSVPSPPTATVKATSVADPTKSVLASVTIVAAVAISLSISPTRASVPTSGPQLFAVGVTGTSNTAVSWNVSGVGCSGSSCGTVSTSGLSAVYSAPSVAPASTVNVTAVSVADPTKSASASVTVVSVVAVTMSPTNTTLPTRATQQFNASVSGMSNTTVTWSLSGAGCTGATCGIINANGLYTAPTVPPSPDIVSVSATSVENPTISAAVDVTIDSAPLISLLVTSTISQSGATITWNTDKASNSLVEYGATAAYGNSSPLDSSTVTSHAVTLSGLSAGIQYHFRVKSLDAAGSASVSGDSSFTTASAVPPTAVAKKKFIYHGWSSPEDAYIRDNWQNIDQLPVNGTTLFVKPGGQSFRDLVMSSTVFQDSDVQTVITNLQTAHLQKVTDNFVVVWLAGGREDGGFDWFDDTRWAIITKHWIQLATMAKQGNLKGIFMDPEDYGYNSGFRPWMYSAMVSRNNQSLAAYQAEVKLRGQQVMNAIKAIYPDITIFTTFAYSLPYLYSYGGSTTLSNNRYGLYGPFLDGVMEAADSRFKLIEGDENAFYGVFTDSQFASERNLIHNTFVQMTADPNLYSSYVQAGFGLYLDEGSFDSVNLNNNYFSPSKFSSTLTSALNQTDQYVWVYSEKIGLFPTDNTNGGSMQPIPGPYLSAMQSILVQFAQPPSATPTPTPIP
jgi:hypothetical protein